MAVGVEIPIDTYTGNGSTTVFPFTFTTLDADYVKTYVDDVLVTSGITVNAADVTFSTAPTTGQKVVIIRETPRDQDVPFTDPQATTLAEVGRVADKGIMIHQELAEELGRSLKTNPGYTLPGGGIEQAANTTLGQDENGDWVNRTASEQAEHLGIKTSVDDAAASATAAASSAAEASSKAAAAAASAADVENAVIAEAKSPRNLPRSLQKIYDLNNGTWQGTTFNHFTVFNLADSLGLLGVYPRIEDILASNLSVAGLGFDRLIYKEISGTIIYPSSGNPRRTDLWGFGTTMQIKNHAVMHIGEPFAGDQIIPFQCTDVSFYFGQETGGGTVDIDYSNDEGASWTSLESGVSTNGATSALIKSYNFTERSVIFRLTVTSGNVELIGALLRNKAHQGLVSCQSAVGGNPLTNAILGNTTIFNDIIADVDPDLFLSQWYESTADLTAAFDTFADTVEASSATADHLVFTEHEQDATGDKETNNSPIYRAKAASTDRLVLFETGRVLPQEVIADRGWDDPDAIHLDTAAWEFVAGVLGRDFGFSPANGTLHVVKTGQTGASKRYRFGGKRVNGDLIFDFESNDDSNLTLNFLYDTESDGEKSWGFKRVASDDGTLPQGFQLLYNTVTSGTSTNGVAFEWDSAGRGYMGPLANAAHLARLQLHETFNARNTLRLIHTATTGTPYLIEGFSDSGASTKTMHVERTGEARFASVETPAVTVASLPAATTAGIRRMVSDSSVAASGNFGAIVAGSGANVVPVYSDGTNWRIG